ncbi:hypothetical protein [Halomonas sp. 15WGF]|jgi:hypothetical protein|uniref:hypothetical protein n=1 Tax=Halomonas sp. 15WGF TaxID=2570357 RepID=UPI0010BF5E54|nr:hypothetical protein [Halomonas sp. 15WGF]TKJ10363.1 hypothetical protein E8Q34_11405 [Halomonas sp. 15WGF]
MIPESPSLTDNAEVDLRIGHTFIRSYNDGQPFFKKIVNKLYAKHYEIIQDRSPDYSGPIGQRVEYKYLGLAEGFDIDAAVFTSAWTGEIIPHEQLNII